MPMSELPLVPDTRAASRVTVGLISDTHGLLRPEALAALRGANHLVHAGDIGAPGILASLSALAPLTAVRGNSDTAAWAADVPPANTLAVGNVGIHVVHEVAHLEGKALPHGTRVVVFGHSHRPSVERRDGVLYVNPGSAGPRRFKLPVTVALLHIGEEAVDAVIVELL